MEQMINHGTGWVRMEFLVPARGLIGFRTEFLTDTRGTGIAHHVFEGYEPWFGELRTRPSGSLVADRTGVATSYAMLNLQERGSAVRRADHRGLRGHDRRRELPRRRHGRQHHQGEEAHQHALVDRPTSSSGSCRRAGCRSSSRLEFCREDECVEVTPDAIRIRKVVLDAGQRGRSAARARRA